METQKTHRVAGGQLVYARHDSAATGTPMTFSVFTPPGDGPFPVLIWLSGLTCTEDNFTTKAGAYLSAAQHGMMIVAPDTSPRGPDLKGGEVADSPDYDLGQGAGFYLDARLSPWAPHFRMETYVVEELRALIARNFPADLARTGVAGHSMGGHGALTLALRHPRIFRSVSAFAPIVNPADCPWGEKAFRAYLGDDVATWKQHDACELLRHAGGKVFPDILIDQGMADPFLDSQLRPERFEAACEAVGQPLILRRQGGYDHSYFFISTFIADHVRWHSERLQ